MSHFQARVPEEGEEGFNAGLEGFLRARLYQQQQINIGSGQQIPAPVAAHRNQRHGRAVYMTLPGMGQQPVDQPGALVDDVTDRVAGGKAPVQVAIAPLQRLPELRHRRAGAVQSGLIEQLGICEGH